MAVGVTSARTAASASKVVPRGQDEVLELGHEHRRDRRNAARDRLTLGGVGR